MNTQPPSRPVITPAMREQAAKQPNTWLYVVDPIFTEPNAEVPPWGYVGGYRVDQHGKITDDFSPNPNYRPSPVALRLPAPSNDAERALQLATTGYTQGQALLTALLDAELILFAQPQGSGLFTMDHESGRRQLQIFTSDSHLPANWTTWQRMTGRQLAAHQPTGVDLQVNPTSPVKARIPAEDLIKAAGSPAAGIPTGGIAGVGTTDSGEASTPPSPPRPDSTQPVPGELTESSTADGASAASPAETSPALSPDPVLTEHGQRFLGALLGGAIGDALGATVEFYPIEQIRSRYGEQGVTDYDREGDRAGEFTDDTQMALFTLEGLVRGHIATSNGVADTPLAAVQLAYQRWLHTQGYGWPRVVGAFADKHPEPSGWLIEQQELFTGRSPNSACITALRDFAAGANPGTFEHAVNDSADCSGVVRAASVALWSDEGREVFELAAATAALTTSHPNGYLPAGVVAVLTHGLLHGAELFESLHQARALLVEYAGHEDTESALRAAENLAGQGKPTPEQLKDTLGGGWTGDEALAIAVCALLSSNTLAEAIMMAVTHSGNSDSTGALCGTLGGAIHGVSALPGVWLRDLKQREIIETIGKDALVEFGPKPPANDKWTKRYPAGHDTSDVGFISKLPRAASSTTEFERVPAESQSSESQSPESQSTESQSAESQSGDSVLEGSSGDDSGAADSGIDRSDSAEFVDGTLSASEQRDAHVGDAPPKIPKRKANENTVAEHSGTEQGNSTVDAPVRTTEGLTTRGESGEFAETSDRVRGFLLGSAVGDFLGFLFGPHSTAPPRTATELDRLFESPSPGEWVSADIQLTLFTVDGLIRSHIEGRCGGTVDPTAQVRLAYQRWYRAARDDHDDSEAEPAQGWLAQDKELTQGRGPDTLTKTTLSGYEDGAQPGSETHRINDSRHPGGVPRSAPASLWSEDPTEVFRLGALTAALTHGHPNGYLPAGALAVIVRQLLEGHSLTESVDRALTELSYWDDHAETSTVLREAVELGAAGPREAARIGERIGGNVANQDVELSESSEISGHQALAIATCATLTYPESFADAVVFAAQLGAGSDTAASICGSIMGAARGFSEIPEKWRSKPHAHTIIKQLADDAISEFGDNPPENEHWWQRYPAASSSSVARAEGSPAAAPEPHGMSTVVTSETSEAPVTTVDDTALDSMELAPTPTAEAAEPARANEESARPASSGEITESAGENTPSTGNNTAGTETQDELSAEEMRLLAAWRKFREGDDDTQSELSDGLRKLLVEAFGPARAAQLVDEESIDAADGEQPADTPVVLSPEERRAGCVIGTAVGDALAAPWTFTSLRGILRDNPDGVREFAESFGRRGAATAVTQQAVFVFRQLIASELRARLRGIGVHLPGVVQDGLKQWMRAQGARFSATFSNEALTEFPALRAQRYPDETTLITIAQWADRRETPTAAEPPNDSCASAATARGAIIGFYAQDPTDAVSLGNDAALITHGHPDGYFPAGALAGMVSGLNTGESLRDSVHTAVSTLEDLDGGETTASSLRTALEITAHGPVSPTMLEEIGAGWHAAEALAIGVSAALSHPNSFSDAVSLAATHSGNTPATAAICGSLLGAARGLDAIPEQWWEELELRDLLELLLSDKSRISTEIFTDSPTPDWAAGYLS